MSLSPYARPLPYGGWALSLTILLGGFFWARAEGISVAGSSHRDGQANRRQTQEGDEEEQPEETRSAHRTSSSAYQTDQEADRAHQQQQKSRRRYSNQRSLFARVRPTPLSLTPPLPWQTTAAAVDGEETYIRRDAAPAALSGFCAAAAAAAASSATRKPHFNHVVEPTDRWRLEREAFRVKVHEHVDRELERMATQAATALAVVTEAEERGSVM
ncbi:unnamed protein product [Ectocarpus sp. CCAP 1310/34]|nr:unnamed protein product [Ectocarpus sp. CCAP 1310/34]